MWQVGMVGVPAWKSESAPSAASRSFQAHWCVAAGGHAPRMSLYSLLPCCVRRQEEVAASLPLFARQRVHLRGATTPLAIALLRRELACQTTLHTNIMGQTQIV